MAFKVNMEIDKLFEFGKKFLVNDAENSLYLKYFEMKSDTCTRKIYFSLIINLKISRVLSIFINHIISNNQL